MSVAAAGRIFCGRTECVAYIHLANKMQMVRDCRNPFVSKFARLAVAPRFVVCSGHDVKQMRIHAVADKRLTVVIPVDAPGIGRPVGVGLPDVADGMIPVDSTVETDAIFLGSTWFSE